MKKVLLYITFTFLSLSVQAQLLWEVSRNGLHQKSYIFATEKLIPISFLDSIPQLYECYAKCPVVITEMQLNAETRDQLMKAATLPSGQSLQDFYSPQDYQHIDSVLTQELQINFLQLARVRPIFLTELYKNELYKRYLDFQEEKSSELFFQLVAIEQGRKIVALDNAMETLQMTFYRKNLDTQARDLLQLINHPHLEVQQAERICQLYKRGLLYDIAYAIQAPSNKTSINYSDYTFIKQRNQRWIPQLHVWMKGQSCFIVLNAAYLGGEEGLLQLLRQEGFRVKRVN